MSRFYLLTDDELREITSRPECFPNMTVSMALELLEHRRTNQLGCEWLWCWPRKCSTCGAEYEKDALSMCSDSFHCCRDCVWLDGRVFAPCEAHSVKNG